MPDNKSEVGFSTLGLHGMTDRNEGLATSDMGENAVFPSHQLTAKLNIFFPE
jgi:hypothetical protein